MDINQNYREVVKEHKRGYLTQPVAAEFNWSDFFSIGFSHRFRYIFRKPHENPSIGIKLCREMNQTFVEFAVRDYNKPMEVATYRASKGMSEQLRNALPDIEDLKKLL